MKILVVSLFSALILVQSFSKWLIVLDYTINKEFIAENLCINKEKSKLACKGKCQLAKQLASEENQNSSSPGNPGKIKLPEVLYTTDWNSDFVFKKIPPITNSTIYVSGAEKPGYIHSIFHPPAMA
ncbi:MAG TPA: hypothetical protein VFQ73_09470 [Flavisolibacter sp.]|nr:hypothetical protein [Flavisolibacter sp.]